MIQKKASLSATEEQPLPVSLFKNSLRQWQARWKAKQTAAPAESAAPQSLEDLLKSRDCQVAAAK